MNIWIVLFIVYYVGCIVGMCRFIYEEEGILSLGHVLATIMILWLVAPFMISGKIIILEKKQ